VALRVGERVGAGPRSEDPGTCSIAIWLRRCAAGGDAKLGGGISAELIAAGAAAAAPPPAECAARRAGAGLCSESIFSPESVEGVASAIALPPLLLERRPGVRGGSSPLFPAKPSTDTPREWSCGCCSGPDPCAGDSNRPSAKAAAGESGTAPCIRPAGAGPAAAAAPLPLLLRSTAISLKMPPSFLPARMLPPTAARPIGERRNASGLLRLPPRPSCSPPSEAPGPPLPFAALRLSFKARLASATAFSRRARLRELPIPALLPLALAPPVKSASMAAPPTRLSLGRGDPSCPAAREYSPDNGENNESPRSGIGLPATEDAMDMDESPPPPPTDMLVEDGVPLPLRPKRTATLSGGLSDSIDVLREEVERGSSSNPPSAVGLCTTLDTCDAEAGGLRKLLAPTEVRERRPAR